jgi:hypothetical protein
MALIAGTIIVVLCVLYLMCDEIEPIRPYWENDPLGPFGD